MAVSAIASQPITFYQPGGSQSSFRADFNALASAISSGNLADAQQAFSSLSALLGNSGSTDTPSSTNSPSSTNPFLQALNQIGQALQSGNLSEAQQALSSLQRAGGAHHHRHNHDAAGNETPNQADSITLTASITASGAAASTASLNITA